MKIVAISDTHSYHRRVKIPDADVLIHAGDITWRGELEIFADFTNWIQELPHKNKLVIFGNHELGMRSGPNRGVVLQMIRDAGAIYLENSGIEIGGTNFYGSPATPYFMDWEWNYPRGKEIAAIWNLIPDNTNVLITHGPPYGILDVVQDRTCGPQGCKDLKNLIRQLPNLKAHVFGHLHHDGGKMVELHGTKFINAAICTDNYVPTNLPIVIEI